MTGSSGELTYLRMVLSFTILASFPALAQNTVTLASAFSQLGQRAPDACVQEAQIVVKYASLYPHPKTGWQFIVVCDDNTWKMFMRGNSNEQGDDYGRTDIDKNITLIRGSKILHPDIGATPEHIIAHELAPIMLHSRDEDKVDKQSILWIEQQRSVATTAANAFIERGK